MAANDPGLMQMGAEADEPTKGALVDTNDESDQVERPLAPDQFDEHLETTRWEIWCL